MLRIGSHWMPSSQRPQRDFSSKWMRRDGSCRRIAERNFPQADFWPAWIVSGWPVILELSRNLGRAPPNRRN